MALLGLAVVHDCCWHDWVVVLSCRIGISWLCTPSTDVCLSFLLMLPVLQA